MPSASQAEVRAAIHKAFATLPLLPNVDYGIPSAVEQLLLWVQPKLIDHHYLDLGKNGVEKELAEIASLARDLQCAVRNMHKPTFNILYDLGIRPVDVNNFCINVQNACRAADVSNVAGKPRPRKTAIVPQAISDTLAHYYRFLTGKRATVSTSTKTNKAGGRFLQLVEEVFEALSLDASAESCARSAVRKKLAQEKQPKSPFDADLMGD